MLFILLSISLLYSVSAGVVDVTPRPEEQIEKKEEFVVPQLAYTRDLDWVFRYANYIPSKTDVIPTHAYGLQGEPNYVFPYANYIQKEVPAAKIKEGTKKAKVIDQTASIVPASFSRNFVGRSSPSTLQDDRERIIEYYENELRPKYEKLLKIHEIMETEPLAVMDKDVVIL